MSTSKQGTLRRHHHTPSGKTRPENILERFDRYDGDLPPRDLVRWYRSQSRLRIACYLSVAQPVPLILTLLITLQMHSGSWHSPRSLHRDPRDQILKGPTAR